MAAKLWVALGVFFSASFTSFAFPVDEPIRTVCNTGALSYRRGEYSRAESLLTSCLARWDGVKNPDDDYSSALNNLAAVYRVRGRYGESEKLYQRALALENNNGGSVSATKANVLHNLAVLYLETGRYTLAEQNALQALDLRRRIFGEHHDAVVRSLNLLGAVLQSEGKVSAAADRFRQALAIGNLLPGRSDTRLAETLTNLAAVLRLSGNFQEAERHLTDAVALLEKLPSTQNGVLLPRALNDFGLLARAEGDDARAEAMFRRALSLWKNSVGIEQPEYASGLSNLGLVYQDRHRLRQARELYSQALRIHESRLGPHSPQVGNDLVNLGQLRYQMHKPADAKAFFTKAIAAETERGGPPTFITGLAEASLGIIAARSNDSELAQDLLQKGAQVLLANVSPNDARLVPILEELASVLKTNGNFAKAEEVEVKATRIRVRNVLAQGAAGVVRPRPS